jgi:site-specific recombinase XerD
MSGSGIKKQNTEYAIELVPSEQESSGSLILRLVLDGLDSAHTRRAYERALRDFMTWLDRQPPALRQLNKATVQRYKSHLRDDLKLSASSISQRLSAIRKLAMEASDNELLDATQAAAIKNVKGVRQEGKRTGNWLSVEQVQKLLNAPDCTTAKGKRDRAALCVLIGGGLRRQEAAALRWEHVQERDGRPVLVDLTGKRNKKRSVPLPSWALVALNDWRGVVPADDKGSCVFLAVNRYGQPVGDGLTPQAIRNIVKEYAGVLGLKDIAPHDLRRTYAKLSYAGGAKLDQIQISLGHQDIKTTQIYLGINQDFKDAPCDHINITF